tara:strand:- start:168 stop:386 length:219 start_codon:yes stop_codon:yes gene_type:complete
MPNFGGIAYSKNYKANPKATTSAGGSPFSITGPGHPAADKPKTNAGTFNAASATDNYAATGSATLPGGAKTA